MRETQLRQRYTAMPRHLMRSRIQPALTRFTNAYCGMLAHLFAYLGIPALPGIAGIRLWDELLEKTETYRTFRYPGRQDVCRWAQQRGNPVSEREMQLGLAGMPEKSRHLARFDHASLPRCWFSCNFFGCRRIM
jgi:hypothetical protein